MPGYAPSVLSYAVYALLLIAVVRYLPHGLVPAFRLATPSRLAAPSPSAPSSPAALSSKERP
jgi:branched-chain amino acid transport system permease protein